MGSAFSALSDYYVQVQNMFYILFGLYLIISSAIILYSYLPFCKMTPYAKSTLTTLLTMLIVFGCIILLLGLMKTGVHSLNFSFNQSVFSVMDKGMTVIMSLVLFVTSILLFQNATGDGCKCSPDVQNKLSMACNITMGLSGIVFLQSCYNTYQIHRVIPKTPEQIVGEAVSIQVDVNAGEGVLLSQLKKVDDVIKNPELQGLMSDKLKNEIRGNRRKIEEQIKKVQTENYVDKLFIDFDENLENKPRQLDLFKSLCDNKEIDAKRLDKTDIIKRIISRDTTGKLKKSGLSGKDCEYIKDLTEMPSGKSPTPGPSGSLPNVSTTNIMDLLARGNAASSEFKAKARHGSLKKFINHLRKDRKHH